MSEEIKVMHGAVEITYWEVRNKWRFTINGRDYELDGLHDCRNKIDEVIKAVKLQRRKQFEPISAYNHSHQHGRITSLVEKRRNYRSEHENWHVRFVVDGEKGPGMTEEISGLYADTPANVELILKIGELSRQQQKLRGDLRRLSNNDLPEIEE